MKPLSHASLRSGIDRRVGNFVYTLSANTKQHVADLLSRMPKTLRWFNHVLRKELTKEKQVLDLARKAKILLVQDLPEKEIHPEHLRRLYKRGLLVRIGRGVYMA